MAKTLWKTKFIFTAYELAKSGMSGVKIARVLGISHPTFRKWVDKKKEFHKAIGEGRRLHKIGNTKGVSFRDYVYKRLPDDLKIIWRGLNKLDKAKSGVEKIEALLDKGGKRARQHLFLYAWVSANFSVSNALGKVNLSRGTFDLWKEKDPDFAALVKEIDWHKKNFFEDHLCKLIKGGDTSATIFANETYNRDRGYSKRADLNVNLTGETTHRVINIDAIKLDIKTRKAILESIRKAQKL